MSDNGPVETKVWAAVAGAGAGGIVGDFALWCLGLMWGSPADAAHADTASQLVPSPVARLVVLLLALTGAAIAGYRAPHTSRPDLAPPFEQRYPPAEISRDGASEPDDGYWTPTGRQMTEPGPDTTPDA